ncbi:hydratase [Bradyrhizobium sp.]|uniref:hydratase n=1 Tax=Bradyrhizobium sp. TaxID=376 RepID=UPI0039E241AF
MNVALYGERRKHWAMTERGRNAVSRNRDEFVIGPSSVDWDGEALTFRIDEVATPFPHRLQGVVRVHPSALTSKAFTLDPAGLHHWHPIAPCSRVQVDFRQPSMRWLGVGYFDMNYGDRPLERDFSSWEWSRADTRKGTVVSYDMVESDHERTSLAMRVDRTGAVEHLEPLPRAKLHPTGWRVPRTARGDAQQLVTVTRTLEDAPFYARSQLSATLLGETADIMHESLSLDRFRMPIVQAMLPFRMPRKSF